MGRLCLLGILGLASCRQPAHVELTLVAQCDPKIVPKVAGADQMDIGCANFVEFLVYQVDPMGRIGNVIGTDCLDAKQLVQSSAMSDLIANGTPTRLLSSIPPNQSVVFRIRAIHAYDTSVGCNDDLAKQAPVKIFDGLSAPFAIDGNDHQVPVVVDQCGSCTNLVPPPMTGTNPCALVPGTTAVPYDQNMYPGGQTCCPPSTLNPSGAVCLKPTDHCPDGASAQLLPGSCCAVCRSAPTAASNG
jgi:hypothetical protein